VYLRSAVGEKKGAFGSFPYQNVPQILQLFDTLTPAQL